MDVKHLTKGGDESVLEIENSTNTTSEQQENLIPQTIVPSIEEEEAITTAKFDTSGLKIQDEMSDELIPEQYANSVTK